MVKANKNYLIAAKEVRRYLKSEKFRMDSPDKAFIKWYKLARFGSSGELQLLDGSSDGGIDACLEIDGKIFIIQSKYEIKPRISNVSRDEIAGFEKIAHRFKNKNETEEFENWLNTVRSQIRNKYKSIKQRIKKEPQKVCFLFITTKCFSLPASESVTVEDAERITALWDLYKKDFTPPAESIELDMRDAWDVTSENNYLTYVGLADVKDFLNLMDIDKNERLFAQNVRTDLHTTINEEIKTTYEKEPDKFWLGNNGVYIVCEKIIQSGDKYTLIYPSIINGSQTLHAIYSSRKRHSCKIMVRILEMDTTGDPHLLSSVIRRTNTQNTMKFVNLFAHDPFQMHIARYLDRYKIFYERREKEWQNEKKYFLLSYYHIEIKQVAQWLSTLHQSIGFGRARSRVSELFKGEYYKQIFSDFDHNLGNSKYHDLKVITWAGIFTQNLIYYYPRQFRQFPKMAQLLIVKSLFDSIYMSSRTKDSIDNLLSSHRFGWKNIPRPIVAKYRECVNQFIKLQKDTQRKDYNIDYSNFFKRDDLCKKAYRKVFTPANLKKIAKELDRNINKIG